jgi:hypothetical protein
MTSSRRPLTSQSGARDAGARTETKQARYRRTHGRPSRAQAPHVLTLVLPDGTPVAEYGWRVQGRGFTGHFMRRLTPPGTL